MWVAQVDILTDKTIHTFSVQKKKEKQVNRVLQDDLTEEEYEDLLDAAEGTWSRDTYLKYCWPDL